MRRVTLFIILAQTLILISSAYTQSSPPPLNIDEKGNGGDAYVIQFRARVFNLRRVAWPEMQKGNFSFTTAQFEHIARNILQDSGDPEAIRTETTGTPLYDEFNNKRAALADLAGRKILISKSEWDSYSIENQYLNALHEIGRFLNNENEMDYVVFPVLWNVLKKEILSSDSPCLDDANRHITELYDYAIKQMEENTIALLSRPSHIKTAPLSKWWPAEQFGLQRGFILENSVVHFPSADNSVLEVFVPTQKKSQPSILLPDPTHQIWDKISVHSQCDHMLGRFRIIQILTEEADLPALEPAATVSKNSPSTLVCTGSDFSMTLTIPYLTKKIRMPFYHPTLGEIPSEGGFVFYSSPDNVYTQYFDPTSPLLESRGGVTIDITDRITHESFELNDVDVGFGASIDPEGTWIATDLIENSYNDPSGLSFRWSGERNSLDPKSFTVQAEFKTASNSIAFKGSLTCKSNLRIDPFTAAASQF